MELDRSREAKLFHDGLAALSQPMQGKALLVIGGNACVACAVSMVNNRYAERTSNGTPIYWLDIMDPQGYARFRQLPGVVMHGGDVASIAGSALPQGEGIPMPTTMLLENGRIMQVLADAEIHPGGFDTLLAQAATAVPAQGSGRHVPDARPRTSGQKR